VQPDFAFHLAAQPLVLDSYAAPLDTFSTNIMGTAHFLECVRETQSLKAAVVVTSDKCYRNSGGDHAFVEDDPLGGKDPYSASKAACEVVALSYIQSFGSQRGGQPIATARAGNVIGGGDWCDNRLVPDLFRAIEANRHLTIRNPDAVRPWQHVLEAIGGYLLLGARLAQDTSLQGAWNFGPIKENCVPVRKLIEALVNRLDAGEVLIERDTTDREATVLKLNTEKAYTLLGWQPVLDFESTVKFTAEGYTATATEPLQSRILQIQEYVEILRTQVPDWGRSPNTGR
jgi:CDP-glucose 4,6-dehydratase